MSEFFDQVFCESNKEFSLIVEDNGKVAYAYLLQQKNIIGDIWLYNQASTPQEVNWNNQKEMPFLNSAEYVQKSKKIIPITDKEEVHVEWKLSDRDQKLIEVNIFLRDRLIAKMSPGSKPGWSNTVKKDGPLAKVLR